MHDRARKPRLGHVCVHAWSPASNKYTYAYVVRSIDGVRALCRMKKKKDVQQPFILSGAVGERKRSKGLGLSGNQLKHHVGERKERERKDRRICIQQAAYICILILNESKVRNTARLAHHDMP
jgi:hypothetical protein